MAGQLAAAVNSRPHLASALLLAALIAACGWLGLGPYFIGPSDFDDALYCDFAATGAVSWELRNRYVHIWLLRLSSVLVDERRLAASLYSTATVIGLGWLGFLLGKRIAGFACGVAAMIAVVLFPPMLRYVSVPHVDLTMTFFALLAILAACAALCREGRRGLAWAALSGAAAYAALKSKETALPLPALLVYLGATQSTRRAQHALAFGSGLLLGFGVLALLDLSLLASRPWLPSSPLNYFEGKPAGEKVFGLPHPPGPVKYLRHRHLFGELMQPAFWAFLFMGVAGMAHGFRRSPVVKALALWFLASVALTLVVAWRSTRIQIYDRYLIGPGAVLAVMTAYWLFTLFRRPREREAENAIWLVPLQLGLLAIALPALAATFGTPSETDRNAVVFVLPFALFTLAMTPWFCGGRLLPLGSAVALLLVSAYASVMTAHEHVADRRKELAPWIELARGTDRDNAGVAVWKPPGKYPARRVTWRTRMLSRREAHAVHVRALDDLSQLGPDEWVFTRGCAREDLVRRGFTEVVRARCDERQWAWSAYRRARQAARVSGKTPARRHARAG